MTLLAERRFTLSDQEWFAQLSRDRNPLHVDPVAARRSMFGHPVVHGVHALTWALDAFLARRHADVARIAVNFRRPVLLDEAVEAWVVSDQLDAAELQVRRDDSVLLAARLQLRRPRPAPPIVETAAGAPDVLRKPRELEADEIVEGRAGQMPLDASTDLITDGFPAASRLGAETIASLAGLSRLVGMECPGLHSLFTGFDVHLGDGSFSGRLDWEVTRADDRFGAVRMSVSTGSLHGTVDAFVRPRPASQIGSAELKSIIEHDEFSKMQALVIGGSRGLGELTAKIVAAGGGESVLTWHRGESDALEVLRDIRASGGRASTVQFDTSDPDPRLLVAAMRESPPTHLFYFATPRIFARRTQTFDPELYAGFSDVYVTGFVRLVKSTLNVATDELVAFYPSTVAIDEHILDLTEYAAAKAAGEVVAQTLGQGETGLRVVVERLPRVPTDQTASVVAIPAAAPVELMLSVVRRMLEC